MNSQSGVTMLEIVAVVAIMGIGLSVAALMLQPLETPLEAGASLTEGVFRQARLEAMATTSAYRVSPENKWILGAETAPSCNSDSDEWEADSTVEVQLPEGVTVAAEDWVVCFSSRGISETNQIIELVHGHYGSIQVEVLLGGTTRVLK